MDIRKLLVKVFAASPVHCSKKEEVELDDPAFSQIDPHLKVDENEDSLEENDEMTPPGAPRKVSRKPPPFHAIFNNIKAITAKVEHIKGFKFEISTPISQRFFINHSWIIPNSSAEGAAAPPQNPMMGMGKPPATSSYTLATQYIGGPKEDLMVSGPKFILSARVDSQGKLDASYIRFFNPNWNLQFHSQFPFGSDVKQAQINADLNYEGEDSISTLKYTTGAVGFGHVQTIGNKLVIGFESIFGTMQNLTMLNYSGRYSINQRNVLFGNYSAAQDQANIAYQLIVNKRCRLVSELSYKLSEKSTQTVIGFRQKMSESETIATISSKGKISTALNLNGTGYSLKLCAVADFFKDSYKFGYGISLGGQSKEEKEKEQEQSRIKNERQPENQDKLINEQQQQKIEKEIQQNYQNQSRNRICSFSELHGNDHNLPSNIYSHTVYQSVNVQQKETHRISSTPIFKPANNLLQESQDIPNFQLHQKQGVVELDLDQHSMESELEGESNSLAQRRKEEQHQQDNLLKKRRYVPERNDKDISQIADEEDEKVEYSVSKAYETFKKQKTDRIMKFQAQKQQQNITQMNYLSVPYVNQVQKVCEITNNNQMQQRQLSEQLGQWQQSSFQPSQVQSSVSQEISQPKQPVATQPEQGTTTKLTQPTMQQKDLISSNRSPSFDANKKSQFLVQSEDSSKKQFCSSFAEGEIPKSQAAHVAPSPRKSSHSENQIPEKKQLQQQQKQPEQQVQQQLSAPLLQTTDTSSKSGLFGNLKVPPPMIVTNPQPSVILTPTNENITSKSGLFGNLKVPPPMIVTNPQPSVIVTPTNENITSKQGLFGNLKAPTSMAADPQSAVFAPVKNNKTVDIPSLDLSSSTHTNSFADAQKQFKAKEETEVKPKVNEQQQQEEQKQPQEQQLFLQSPETKKVVQVQTPLFQSQKEPAVSSLPLDNIKSEDKLSQPSLFNTNGLSSQNNNNNPKPLIVPNRTALLDSPSIASPTLIGQENTTSKPLGTALFAGLTTGQPVGSLFGPASSDQLDKEPSQKNSLPEKPIGLFEQQKQPEITEKPIEFKINTLPPKNKNLLQIQKVSEDPSNAPSVQVEDTSKTVETKAPAPLTGGLFDQVIKKEGETQKVGLFQNLPKPNGLFSGQAQQQSVLASTSSSQSLFQPNTPQPPQQPEASKENDKIEKKQQTQSTSLFGSLPQIQKSKIQGTSNLSSNQTQPKVSLFGSGNSGAGFLNLILPNASNQSIQSGGLFGQTISNKSVDPSQTNLGTTSSQNQPTGLPSTGLFGKAAENTNSSTKGSLFSIPPATQNGSLFPSTSLFKQDPSKQPSSGGLFGNLANSTNSTLFGSAPSKQN